MKKDHETPQNNSYPQEVTTAGIVQETNHMDMSSICRSSYYIANHVKIDIQPRTHYYNFLLEVRNTGYSSAAPQNQKITILALRDLEVSSYTLGAAKGQSFSKNQ